MRQLISRFGHDNQGVTAIDHALLAGLMAIFLAAALPPVTSGLQTSFMMIASELTDATTSTISSGLATSRSYR